MLWLALGGSLGVIGMTYVLTPHELNWHIQHSAGRLMLLPFLILVALLWRSLIGVLAIREPVSQDTE